MKKLIVCAAVLSFFYGSSGLAQDAPGLTLQNAGHFDGNPYEWWVLTNKNAQNNVDLSADMLQPISNDQVPYYSYLYNGQTSVMDLNCGDKGSPVQGDIYITYDKDKGIQSVKGTCAFFMNNKWHLVTPNWDGTPHGMISFAMVD